jgi:glycosyltransferase involved in cell wall biosynthesis
MAKVSVIIPTCERPEQLKRAISSVLAQTYQDFEVLVVDDGLAVRADKVIQTFSSNKIRYFQSPGRRGASAARNFGIVNSTAPFVAFLDDDDEWLPEKLKKQMEQFEFTTAEVGFCFSAVTNVYGDREVVTRVPAGLADYFEQALANLNGFLTVTLIVKRAVLNDVGLFDENLPSHQDPDLVIRVAKKYQGIGLNEPLVNVSMESGPGQIGASKDRKIAGRLMILKKYGSDFRERPKLLARNYFDLAIMFRMAGQFKEARVFLGRALRLNLTGRHLFHYLKSFFF